MTARDEREFGTQAFDLPIMMVSFGARGSGAHMSPVNTSTGRRTTPRLRVVFQNVPTTVVGSFATATLVVPNDPSLLGTDVHAQAAIADPGVNVAGLIVSDGATLVPGGR